jgi:hypothetical protein
MALSICSLKSKSKSYCEVMIDFTNRGIFSIICEMTFRFPALAFRRIKDSGLFRPVPVIRSEKVRER